MGGHCASDKSTASKEVDWWEFVAEFDGPDAGVENFTSAHWSTPDYRIGGFVTLTRYQCRYLLSSDCLCRPLQSVGVGDRRILLSSCGAGGSIYWGPVTFFSSRFGNTEDPCTSRSNSDLCPEYSHLAHHLGWPLLWLWNWYAVMVGICVALGSMGVFSWQRSCIAITTIWSTGWSIESGVSLWSHHSSVEDAGFIAGIMLLYWITSYRLGMNCSAPPHLAAEM